MKKIDFDNELLAILENILSEEELLKIIKYKTDSTISDKNMNKVNSYKFAYDDTLSLYQKAIRTAYILIVEKNKNRSIKSIIEIASNINDQNFIDNCLNKIIYAYQMFVKREENKNNQTKKGACRNKDDKQKDIEKIIGIYSQHSRKIREIYNDWEIMKICFQNKQVLEYIYNTAYSAKNNINIIFNFTYELLKLWKKHDSESKNIYDNEKEIMWTLSLAIAFKKYTGYLNCTNTQNPNYTICIIDWYNFMHQINNNEYPWKNKCDLNNFKQLLEEKFGFINTMLVCMEPSNPVLNFHQHLESFGYKVKYKLQNPLEYWNNFNFHSHLERKDYDHIDGSGDDLIIEELQIIHSMSNLYNFNIIIFSRDSDFMEPVKIITKNQAVKVNVISKSTRISQNYINFLRKHHNTFFVPISSEEITQLTYSASENNVSNHDATTENEEVVARQINENPQKVESFNNKISLVM